MIAKYAITAIRATAIAMLAWPGAARACSVCFSGARDGPALTAYYTVTALMTGAVLLIIATLYFFVFRRYIKDVRDAPPADAPGRGHSPQPQSRPAGGGDSRIPG